MPQKYEPQSHAAALSIALLLAIRAPSDEKAAEAQELAGRIAYQMNDEVQFNAVKDSVEACLAYFNGVPA